MKALSSVAERVELAPGEVLFAEGAHSDAVFVVVRGRLRVSRAVVPTDSGEAVEARVAASPAGPRVDPAEGEFLGEVGVGGVVGELGIIDDHPRSASVAAVRPSLVFRVIRDDFDGLSDDHPKFVLALFRSLLSSAVRGTRVHDPASVIAVGCVDIDRRELLDCMAGELELHGSVDRVDANAVVPGFEDGGVDRCLIDMGPDPSASLSTAVDHADRVLVVVPAPPSAAHLAFIRQAANRSKGVAGRMLWVALQHRADAELPTGAGPLLAIDGVDEVHHVRTGNQGDIQRVTRLLSGQGVGLALGGGGARAYAHVGVLRAFAEVGIPIDRIGGTSQGGVVSAWVAMGKSPDEILGRAEELHRTSVLDYTMPIVALAKGSRIVEKMAMFGGLSAEDLWTPWFTVTTNLTQARANVIRSGPLLRALRATVSLPAIFPPVPIDGDLHVDGGLLDNVPGDVLAADPSIGRVVAVDVTPPGGPKARNDYGLAVGGFASSVAMVRKKARLPSLATTLISSVLVGSDRARRDMVRDNLADLYLSLNLRGIGLFDFEGLPEIAARGYADAAEPLANWWNG